MSRGAAWASAAVDYACLALAPILFSLALFIPDPALFVFRKPIVVTLCGISLSLSAVMALSRRRKTAMLLAVCPVLALWQAARPGLDRAAVLARRPADKTLIARHFVVGYDDVDTVRDLISRGLVGGIFLTRRNVEGRTAASVRAEIAGLQAIRQAAGLPPLVVTADQEGGPVAHLSPPLPQPPSLSTFAGLPAEQRKDAARRFGVEQGSALRELGITMDLAPVLDLTPAYPTAALDRHSRIATRPISVDPAVVASVGAGFSEGLLAAGVTPTVKHFPGLGRVATDTHLFGASLDASPAELKDRDWLPFRAVLGIPGSAVMLSHVSLAAVDGDVPASRSKRIVSGLLRGEWGFDGVAITDDLTMGAVEHAGLCPAVEGALNAGIDLLLVSWDTRRFVARSTHWMPGGSIERC